MCFKERHRIRFGKNLFLEYILSNRKFQKQGSPTRGVQNVIVAEVEMQVYEKAPSISCIILQKNMALRSAT